MSRTSIQAAIGRIVLVIGALALTACEKAVFVEAEIQAKSKFNALKSGTAAQEIMDKLGKPVATITIGTTSKLYRFHEGEASKPLEFQFDSRASSGMPPAVRFLPNRTIANRVLIYIDGTVYAYYFIDKVGVLEEVVIVVS